MRVPRDGAPAARRATLTVPSNSMVRLKPFHRYSVNGLAHRLVSLDAQHTISIAARYFMS